MLLIIFPPHFVPLFHSSTLIFFFLISSPPSFLPFSNYLLLSCSTFRYHVCLSEASLLRHYSSGPQVTDIKLGLDRRRPRTSLHTLLRQIIFFKTAASRLSASNSFCPDYDSRRRIAPSSSSSSSSAAAAASVRSMSP